MPAGKVPRRRMPPLAGACRLVTLINTCAGRPARAATAPDASNASTRPWVALRVHRSRAMLTTTGLAGPAAVIIRDRLKLRVTPAVLVNWTPCRANEEHDVLTDVACETVSVMVQATGVCELQTAAKSSSKRLTAAGAQATVLWPDI